MSWMLEGFAQIQAVASERTAQLWDSAADTRVANAKGRTQSEGGQLGSRRGRSQLEGGQRSCGRAPLTRGWQMRKGRTQSESG